MKQTINKVLVYNLSDFEEECLKEALIINGCGGAGGFNIEPLIREYIENMTGYDKEKGEKLFRDIKKICGEHDIDFRFKKGFYRSNFVFAKKMYKLFKKLGNQFKIALLVFILLNRYGKKFYY